VNRKILVQNLLLVLGAFIFAALVAEILLRILLPTPIVWKYPQERYLFDPEIGHRLQANQEAFTQGKTVTINSQGIRDAEYNSEPAAWITRILALGDSQTFGNGIASEDTWPKQLEQVLNSQAGAEDYEVLNGGLPASDTWQHKILMKRLMSAYNPDIVVLAFYVNDVASKPKSVMNFQGDDTDPTDLRLVYLLKRSALLLSMRTAYDAIRQSTYPPDGFRLWNALLAGESNPEIDRRWEQVEHSLLEMKETAARNDVGFLVVSLPRRDQVDGRLPAEKYNKRLSAVMKRTGVRFINLLGPLQQAYKEHGKELFIPWDGHNTAIANRVIANEISLAISRLSAAKAENSGLPLD
jgi:lysophospholipase L1-like esterase